MNIVSFKWKIATLGKIDHRIIAVVVGFLLFLSVFEVAVSVTPAAASPLCNPLPHEPIFITSDNDFNRTNGVVSGTGTATAMIVARTCTHTNRRTGNGPCSRGTSILYSITGATDLPPN